MLLPRGSVFQRRSVARLYSYLNQRMCWSNLPTYRVPLSSSLECPVARCKLSGLSQHVPKDVAASPQEKATFTSHYLLHSLRQAGPQQLLCFLFQLLLKFLSFMTCKILLSRVFTTYFCPSFSPGTVQNLELYCKIAFLKQEVQLSKKFFHVLKACCQRATFAVGNGQKNKLCWIPINTDSSSQQQHVIAVGLPCQKSEAALQSVSK